MADIETIHKPKLLVVEGRDERNFFTALLAHLQLMDIQVMDIGGKSQIPAKLKALMKMPDFHNVASLGITRDADENPAGAFQSICDALKEAMLPVPKTQISFTRGRPRIGVMILPKPGTKGMLEDVCISSARDTPEMGCVKIYLDCVKKKTMTLPVNLSKAKMYAFLAAKDPGLRLGEAAQKGIWQWDNKAFKQIRVFLKLL
ncbi:MAG: hypothetical protein A2Y48_03220 [Nitrospirae bacterium RIFCSPLOW2_12_42_9]|nr:MAG: hypothetical protein A2Y48_03220 [Nitrospirae bacterium RIFCSPLOW2_12_42_9]HBI23698.1 hypothetical protein [Nitrospiraceae bacterium]